MKQLNVQIIQSTKVCRLALTNLPQEAREYHKIPGLAHTPLLSIGKMCDVGCEARFNQHTMDVTKYKQVVFQDKRDVITGLWRVPLQIFDITKQQSNSIHQVNVRENSIRYLHVEKFSPVQGTWERSINRGYFNTWPGTTEIHINNIPKAKAHRSGSMHVQQQPKITLETRIKTQINITIT